MEFPGTISVSESTFETLDSDILKSLFSQGFDRVYFLNGHGANLTPLQRTAEKFDSAMIRIRSWWEFESVDALRRDYYGEWEGMHATPSEVAVTQVMYRTVPAGIAQAPPKQLSADYILKHSGDRHGPPDKHRKQFPDGRVGSHSALATPSQGEAILTAAGIAVASDCLEFI